jgi:hypothetical protein
VPASALRSLSPLLHDILSPAALHNTLVHDNKRVLGKKNCTLQKNFSSFCVQVRPKGQRFEVSPPVVFLAGEIFDMILNIIECLVCNTLNWVCRFFLWPRIYFWKL